MRRWRVWTTWLPRQRSRGLELRVGSRRMGYYLRPEAHRTEKWANAADDADDRATHNRCAMAPYVPVAASLRQIKPRVAARFLCPMLSQQSVALVTCQACTRGSARAARPLGMVRALAKHTWGNVSQRDTRNHQCLYAFTTRRDAAAVPSTLAAVHTEAHAVRPLSASSGLGRTLSACLAAPATGDFTDGLTDIVVGAVGVGALTRDPAHPDSWQWHDQLLRLRRHRAVWLEPASHGFQPRRRRRCGDRRAGRFWLGCLQIRRFTFDDAEPTYRQFGRVHSSAASTRLPPGVRRKRSRVWARRSHDVDGDGRADLLIGCPRASGYTGRVMAAASSRTHRRRNH